MAVVGGMVGRRVGERDVGGEVGAGDVGGSVVAKPHVSACTIT